MIVSVWVFGRDQEVGTSNGVGSSKDASADSDDDDDVNDGICRLSLEEVSWSSFLPLPNNSLVVLENKDIEDDESTFFTFLVSKS